MKRVSAVLISLFLLISCIPIGMVSASGESSSITSFTGGFATVNVDLQGGVTNNNTTVEVPRNVTFSTVSFDLEVESSETSPGQVWIDIDEDGTFEWEFTGLGYGNIGHQNQFYDGNDWYVSNVNGSSSAPGILLPSSSNLQSSTLNASFYSQAGGGFFQIGEFQEVIETDLDSDGYPEPLFLLNKQSNNSTSFVWADWNSGAGITTSSPIQTCDNATSISVGDLNNDSQEDIIAFSTFSSNACVHLGNGTTFDPVLNLSLSSGLISAKVGDFNSDNFDEIITISAMGSLSFHTWDNTTSTLNSAVTQTIFPNGSQGIPANLVSLYIADFFGNGNESVLISDQMGHWSHWQYFTGGWGGPITTFDNIKQDEIIADFDNDGDLDLIGTNDLGYAMRINDGSDWDLIEVQQQIDILNATITDFENDGVMDVLTPNTGFSDGNSATLEGNLTIRTINGTNLSGLSVMELEPWSLPTSVITMDMDGDGIPEQIVGAGETNYGVFIAGWHSIQLDADGDGSVEMSRSGYAGDSSNGLPPLTMIDEMDGIRDDLSPIISSAPTVIDSYGISMVNYSMNVESSGAGYFNYSNLDIGYDCYFHIDANPHASSNLTNVFNQGMTGGVGNFTINIPVNSTQAGQISLTNIVAVHTPGAPNLSIPITPTLQLISATSEHITIAWNDPIDFGLDFDEFEVFKLESANDSVSLTDIYVSTRDNQTQDTNVTVGSTYWYSVRSVHTFGIASNLSNPLQVTVPYPAPPSEITGTQLTDISSDSGGALQLSWNHSTDTFSHYEVYLENSSFSSISGLSSIATISSSENSTTLTGLTDGQEYWAAVIAVDQYGNSTTSVTSVGPAYPRNDVPMSVSLELDVSSQTSLNSPFYLHVTALIDGNEVTPSGTIQINMETESGTYPLSTNWDSITHDEFANLTSFTNDITGEVTFWANYSGDDGDEQNRPIASASTSATTTVNVEANFYAEEDGYQLDWENETSVRVNLEALNPSQQSLLDGSTIVWTAYNASSNVTTTGTEQITGGSKLFIVSYIGEGILFVNLTNPTWIDAGTNSLQIDLIAYGDQVDENETENNETEPTPWTPETMSDLTIDCGQIIIDPSISQNIDCTITNPNNYSIDVSLEADGWSEWPDFILFEPKAGQSEFSLDAFASNIVEIRVEIIQNLSENGLLNGNLEIDLRQGPKDYTSPADRPVTYSIQWTLIGEDPVVDPEPQDNNTNQTNTGNKDSSSSGNMMVIVGGIGAVAVIGMIVFIVLRIRNSDLDEWDEEDLDLEPVVESDRISKPLPVGVALDEFDDKTIVDESPDRPDIIADFDEEVEYEEEAAEESYEEEYEEAADEDSGITVDEHGTEWYEDEVGVWWFRDPGEEDWSEFVE